MVDIRHCNQCELLSLNDTMLELQNWEEQGGCPFYPHKWANKTTAKMTETQELLFFKLTKFHPSPSIWAWANATKVEKGFKPESQAS